ncbi:MAG TPA: DNA polymerase III subunit gamma/tau [Pyrinomonadaceae bacterium]
MSYQVIARKWRPQTFEEVTGQELITQTLKNAIEHDRLHHAYLFSGARGVGKTTTARLLAKALNCRKTDGPNVHPCRIDDPTACVSCVEIAESRSMDVLEIDAASNTGIDNVRDVIIDGINIIPARDRYKVFIIDEVHQLSKPAFNALLKTLEEPPPKVVFIMATTELHKVPDTIASRTQQFEFRTISLQKIYDRLKLIAETEKINISDEALREIARSGDGSMRDAQSNFDQVISFAGEKISVADVGNALGLASIDMLIRVLDAIVTNEPREALKVVDELSTHGQDFRNFCRDLLGLIRDLLVARVGGEAQLVETSMLSADELKRRAKVFSESDLVRLFHSLADTETRIKDASQPRYLLEIGLVKLVEMRRLTDLETVLTRLSEIEQSLGQGVTAPLAAAAPAEKKTLNPKPVDVPVAEGISEPQPSSARVLDLIESMPVRLPPIPSEELEHVEDAWLDETYERKLAWSGDDLAPLAAVAKPLLEIVATAATSPALRSASNGNSQNAAAVAMALAEANESAVPDSQELPQLGPDATDEELLAYAKAHPAVRAALKVFRGKIVKVTRRGEKHDR